MSEADPAQAGSVIDRPAPERWIAPAHAAGHRARLGEDGLVDMVEHLAHQCGANGVLVLWHPRCARAQILCHIGTARALSAQEAYSERATAAAVVPVRESIGFAFDAPFMTAAIPLDSGTITFTGLLDEPTAQSAGRCRECLRNLLPLVKPFFEQWLATQRAVARMQCMQQAVQISDMAIIMLGSAAEIIYANDAAEQILGATDGLRRNGERLACRAFSDTLRLQAALDQFGDQAGSDRSLCPVLALGRDRRRPLTIALTAAQPARGALPDEVKAIAYVFDPEKDLTGIVEPACQLYRLSHRETKLTCALVEGISLAAAASRLGLQEQTARSYLKRVFAKTDTNRQAELVQLMLKSAVRIAGEGRTQAFA